MSARGTFLRPTTLDATSPAEERLGSRDAVRLLVSGDAGDTIVPFRSLDSVLAPGDLLVVNESRTLAASLPAEASFGEFRLNLSTHYGGRVWVAEPRWDHARPGPLPLVPGDRFRVPGVEGRILTEFPGMPRLLFVSLEGEVEAAMDTFGEPIRYRYLPHGYPLDAYQTIFARVPGSAEMPSAGRPFTQAQLRRLEDRGVAVARILLHTGVSSLELPDIRPGNLPVYPEPFDVPKHTAESVNRTRCSGGRVVAVGTTVVRALESAAGPNGVRAARGFTRAYIHPERPVTVVDGLLTGLHDAGTTHLAMLESVVGVDRVGRAYHTAVQAGMLWHEFGDSHLMWRPGQDRPAAT